MLSDRDRREIQGLVLYGTTCPLLRYHFFKVREAVDGRRFVQGLVEHGSPLHVTAAGLRDKDVRSESLIYAGFTWHGLQALAVSSVALNSFPEEFRAGAKARAADLGDTGASSPANWAFDPDDAHIAVLIYARDQDRLDDLTRQLLDRASTHNCDVVTMLDGQALPDSTHSSGQRLTKPVHFGYSDGISQPELLPAPGRVPGAPPAVPPGMFILGHPDSPQDGESFAVSNQPMPIPTHLANNGTFGAFRVLEQDVVAFEEFLDANAATPHERELLAARMCGRWRNGVPLSLSPDSPNPPVAVPRDQMNAFDYRPTPALPQAADDRDGRICPVGSHIRRANPRSADVLGHMGNRLRLIRRGMPYGPPYDPAHKRDGIARGMLGLFLCVSLKDQFEFIMRHWINDGLFARGLPPGDKDPMVGAQQDGDSFSYRTTDGTVRQTAGLSRFVTTRAGAYLFFPSLTGLRFIAQLREHRPTEQSQQAIEESVDFIVRAMKQALGNGTTRDAHTKHHGLVRATVEIVADLPDALRHGLFATARSFQAYIRFSNGRPTPVLPPDAAPDVRGMAIKLLGVPGVKEAKDEVHTHDIVLASHPVFFVPDVHAYVDFLRLPSLAEKMRLYPELARSFRSFENPLTIRYFSQTPYALGPHVIKYVVEPLDPAEQPPLNLTPEQIAARTPNCLREAMAAHLAARPATMMLSVQLAPDAAAEQVDDATRLWQTTPIPIATITIPAQEFTRPANDQLAETLSFSPWHCLHENRPLGSVNLARRRVYREASVQRHANRAAAVQEPDGVHDLD
jgi:Dyp-type peroxidase family